MNVFLLHETSVKWRDKFHEVPLSYVVSLASVAKCECVKLANDECIITSHFYECYTLFVTSLMIVFGHG